MTFFSFNILSVNSLKCISMKNQECKVRPKIINNDLHYPFSIKVNKCSENCDSINNPYFKFECKLNSSVCNNKQKWNKDKCKCECNKINRCDKDFI